MVERSVYEEERERRQIDAVKALEAALDSAQRGFWGQCRARVKRARRAVKDWAKWAEHKQESEREAKHG